MRIKGKGKSILTRKRLPVLGLFEGLLDQVSGAAAAYSIRLLRADYSDGLLRVRAYDSANGVDKGEADVRPYKIGDEKYVDLNSPIENLDSVASDPNGRDLSNSDTLGDLVDSGGANYDGFVPKWYEQSPNARHATNTTASEQPQLVSAGKILKLGGKPNIYFDGSSYLVSNYAANEENKSFTTFAVIKTVGKPIIIQGGRTHVQKNNGNLACNIGGVQTGTSSKVDEEVIFSFTWNLGTGENKVYKNDVFDDNDNKSPDRSATQLGFAALQGGSAVTEVNQQEIIYFEEVKSNRSDIDNKINNFYGKY